MIYENAVEQVREMRGELPTYLRLAKVSSLSSGRAYVQFYGETTPSTKLYPYVEGYKPKVGDTVLLNVQGETYVIIGKVSKDSITDNYYLTKSDVDGVYLTQAEADTLYDPLGAAAEYKRQLRNSGHWFGFNGEDNIIRFGTLGSGSPDPIQFGMPAPYGRVTQGFFIDLGNDSNNYSVDNLYVKDIKVFDGNIIPANNNKCNIGTSSSKQFNNVYAKQFYQNGTAISTSDKRKKTGIKGIAKKYVEFFKKLRPVLFRFKDGESGRTHAGFIAQEVEEAAHEAGIENKELAFLCIDEDGTYGLRYEELIAIQTQIIQDLMVRVEKLEGSIKA